jgi:hypothetical protein
MRLMAVSTVAPVALARLAALLVLAVSEVTLATAELVEQPELVDTEVMEAKEVLAAPFQLAWLTLGTLSLT